MMSDVLVLDRRFGTVSSSLQVQHRSPSTRHYLCGLPDMLSDITNMRFKIQESNISLLAEISKLDG